MEDDHNASSAHRNNTFAYNKTISFKFNLKDHSPILRTTLLQMPLVANEFIKIVVLLRK